MSQARKPLLLIIDDEKSIRGSIAAYFEDCGYTVIEACDGRQGMEIVRAARPDIVITDLCMPNMDGLEVVDAIRCIDESMPIIILSGTGVLADAIEALRRGAWDYITKPVQDMGELELIVVRSLERARLVSENRAYHENLEQLITQRTAELRKLFTAVEQSANCVMITNVEGVIEYVNPKFTKVTGFSLDEALGQTPQILKSGKHPETFYRDLWETILSGREWSGEFSNLTKDGRPYWELCSIAPIRDEEGTITHFVGIMEDITGRKQHEEQLLFQANHDQLTGLPNRYHLQSYLEIQFDQEDRANHLHCLVLLGIDNLKFVNDTFGHRFGDLLLKEVALRLKRTCGSDSFVSRFLGDEFVIVFHLSDSMDDPRSQAEMIRSAMNGVFTVNGTEVMATASIGVVCYPEDGECVETLLKNAEAAMYQAKKDGRNTVVYYTREMNNRLLERLGLETRLHQALERGEFSLNYQPQVSLSTGAITGMEALLRWTPEGSSPVAPSQFIPLLEESGLIISVGEWVLWHACSQCVEWQKSGLPPLRVSVNISALQFIRSDLDVTVLRVLQITGLDPRLLCLELTESMIMIDSTRTMEKLESLTRTGVTLSLDDFGTGYSSLEYLGRLPLAELKIDRSFIMRMLSTKNDAVVVNTIIAMGHSLNMGLVAEGVETEEQLLYLLEKNCGTIQGFLFSQPLSAEEFAAFFREWTPHFTPLACSATMDRNTLEYL